MHIVPRSDTISSHGQAEIPACHPVICRRCMANPNKKPVGKDAGHSHHEHRAWPLQPSAQNRETPNGKVPDSPEYEHY